MKKVNRSIIPIIKRILSLISDLAIAAAFTLKVVYSYLRKNVLAVLALAVVLIVFAVFTSLPAALLTALLLFALIIKFDSRVPFILGCLSFFMGFLLEILTAETVAEVFLVWAYYYFSISVIIFIFEIVKEKRLGASNRLDSGKNGQ